MINFRGTREKVPTWEGLKNLKKMRRSIVWNDYDLDSTFKCMFLSILLFWLVMPSFLVPQIQNLDFLCSLFPKIAFISMFPSFSAPVPASFPWNKCPLFPCSPKPLGGPHFQIQNTCNQYWFWKYESKDIAWHCLTMLNFKRFIQSSIFLHTVFFVTPLNSHTV